LNPKPRPLRERETDKKTIMEKEKPKRIQRKRIKGWRMPPNTVSVCRPGKWGNPYKVVPVGGLWGLYCPEINATTAHSRKKINVVRASIEFFRDECADRPEFRDEIRKELKGKNLACFCRIDQPCHADVLLEIANS
jgi:hypothetical protein